MTKQYSVVGVDRAYYALVTQDDKNGYVVGTPKQLTQAMELKGTTEVSREDQYADNALHDAALAEGPTTFEMIGPNIAEDVIAELLGEVYDTASGRIFDDADATQVVYFAFGYRFKKRNGKYRYRWYLKCQAEKPGEEAVSESPTPNLKPSTLKISAYKTIYEFDLLGDGSRMSGVKRVRGDEDLPDFDASVWFDAVQIPVAGTPDAFSVSSSPADGAIDVLVEANIVLTFSNALAGGREAGIVLVNADTQAPVAVARTINDARKIVTLNPSSDLSATTDYLIVVHDVVDIHGQALANTVINFTTEA
jgi:phi13 family phage major tail protein